ncbi:hypothetical protein N9P68_01695 [Pseudomonadales bacterium]|nr:hypothetical protein [Pseudomonadales bacterium]
MDTGFLIIAWIVSGVIGLVLGAIVDKLGSGFFLGLLLGPIGWIIVFLLPRDTQTQVANAESTPASKPTSSRPERDLDSDAYKIWLGKQYNITKNDLFDKYECDEKLFATLDEALDYADKLEDTKVIPEKYIVDQSRGTGRRVREISHNRQLALQESRNNLIYSLIAFTVIFFIAIIIFANA